MDELQRSPALTPAAQSALDDMIEVYRQRLLLTATEMAKSRGGTQQIITLEDVNDAIESENAELERLRTNAGRIRKFGSWLLTFSLTVVAGVLLLVIEYSQIFFVSPSPQTESPQLTIFQRPAAEVLTWLGVILGSLSAVGILATLIIRASRKDITKEVTVAERQRELLSSWADLERAARDYRAQQYGESTATTPIRAVLHLDLFPREMQTQLEQALQMRNDTAHARREYTQDEYQATISTIKMATEKLMSAA